MANFNPKQKRDQRGRWQKRNCLKKAFNRFFSGNTKEEKTVAPHNTEEHPADRKAPQMANTALKGTAETIAEIKTEITRLAEWIDPRETGKFPRTVIKQIRRNLEQYEAALMAGEKLIAVAIDSPRVAIMGEAAEIEQFLPLVKGLPPGACKCLK